MTNTLLLSLPFLLFVVVLLMLELGYQYQMAAERRSGTLIPSSSPVSATVLPIMGLVLAFTFSNAAGRLDASRGTILNEVNAIETTWLRIDVAAPQAQPRLRTLLQAYLDTRIRAYEVFDDIPEYQRQLQNGRELLDQIWSLAVQATEVNVNRTLLLSAVNALGDSAATRTLSLGTHLPSIVMVFTFGIVLIGSMLIGVLLGGPDNRHWFERVIVAAVLSVIVYAIMDMEYPRLGARLLERADMMLVELRKSMR